jgi:hypothetical protein
MVLVPAVAQRAPGAVAQPAPAQPVRADDILGRCPTMSEVAAINQRIPLSFEGDSASGSVVCRRSAGSSDLTLLQTRVYQALLIAQHARFSQPLPWTSKELYDWLAETILGIRFRTDIDLSYCCDSARVINVRANGMSAVDPQYYP